jgi:hypothetical protein
MGRGFINHGVRKSLAVYMYSQNTARLDRELLADWLRSYCLFIEMPWSRVGEGKQRMCFHVGVCVCMREGGRERERERKREREMCRLSFFSGFPFKTLFAIFLLPSPLSYLLIFQLS